MDFYSSVSIHSFILNIPFGHIYSNPTSDTIKSLGLSTHLFDHYSVLQLATGTHLTVFAMICAIS